MLFFVAGILINPVNIFPVLKPFRPQYLFAIFATIGLVNGLFKKTYRLNWTAIQTSYTLFMIASLLSLVNLLEYGLLADGLDRVDNTFKTWIMFVLISSYAAHPRFIKICFGFFFFIIGLFQIHCLKAIYFGVAFVQGRFDSWVGQISNPDEIGLFFAAMVPMQLELFLVQKTFAKKLTFLSSALISLFIMIKTQARGAFLSLIVVMALWLITREKFQRRIKIFVLVSGMFMLFGIYTKTDTEYKGGFFSRMETIFSSKSRAEDSNIQTRIRLWKQGIEIWSKFPLLGCGVGGMDPHQTKEDGIDITGGLGLTRYSLHQSFIQVFAERGALGGISYVFFIYLILHYLAKTKKRCREDELPDFFLSIATGLQLGTVGFIIGSFFMSVQEHWILIFFSGFTSALYKATELTVGK